MRDNFAQNSRPGYKLIFRKAIRTRDGRILRRPNGGVFPIWIKIDSGKTAA